MFEDFEHYARSTWAALRKLVTVRTVDQLPGSNEAVVAAWSGPVDLPGLPVLIRPVYLDPQQRGRGYALMRFYAHRSVRTATEGSKDGVVTPGQAKRHPMAPLPCAYPVGVDDAVRQTALDLATLLAGKQPVAAPAGLLPLQTLTRHAWSPGPVPHRQDGPTREEIAAEASPVVPQPRQPEALPAHHAEPAVPSGTRSSRRGQSAPQSGNRGRSGKPQVKRDSPRRLNPGEECTGLLKSFGSEKRHHGGGRVGDTYVVCMQDETRSEDVELYGVNLRTLIELEGAVIGDRVWVKFKERERVNETRFDPDTGQEVPFTKTVNIYELNKLPPL